MDRSTWLKEIRRETALTDLVTENDPQRDFQSSQVRYLRLPKRIS